MVSGPDIRGILPLSEKDMQANMPGPIPNTLLDPVNLMTHSVEFFVPVGRDGHNTMLGLWFDTVGFLHIYIQQAVVPDNIFTQVKIISLRTPLPLGFLIFNLAAALFFARAFILAIRAATMETAEDIQKMLEKVMDKINRKKGNP